ncbi:unnamed protein product [Pedinophyceae sp. YPF-701]|nr:unnamed protein product [Pedinophyceae sp. YPF-701]
MAKVGQQFETGHQDMVHDVQFDYYGKRVATCSSDRTVKVFEVTESGNQFLADLPGHEGPVWRVSWAHPKFGSLLASCSFDHRVIIWKETDAGWIQAYRSPDTVHTASVNAVAWAPSELGLQLACASSDGTLSVLTHSSENGQSSWHVSKVTNAHPMGATGISWAPATPAGSLISAAPPSAPVRRLVSCGCDNQVKVWTAGPSGAWEQDGGTLSAHEGWVRDVAWAPSLGLPCNTVASAGQDGKVFVWSEGEPRAWTRHELHDFGAPVWAVSWSVTGGLLAVTDGNSQVTLWKRALDGSWQQIVGQAA